MIARLFIKTVSRKVVAALTPLIVRRGSPTCYLFHRLILPLKKRSHTFRECKGEGGEDDKDKL